MRRAVVGPRRRVRRHRDLVRARQHGQRPPVLGHGVVRKPRPRPRHIGAARRDAPCIRNRREIREHKGFALREGRACRDRTIPTSLREGRACRDQFNLVRAERERRAVVGLRLRRRRERDRPLRDRHVHPARVGVVVVGLHREPHRRVRGVREARRLAAPHGILREGRACRGRAVPTALREGRACRGRAVRKIPHPRGLQQLRRHHHLRRDAVVDLRDVVRPEDLLRADAGVRHPEHALLQHEVVVARAVGARRRLDDPHGRKPVRDDAVAVRPVRRGADGARRVDRDAQLVPGEQLVAVPDAPRRGAVLFAVVGPRRRIGRDGDLVAADRHLQRLPARDRHVVVRDLRRRAVAVGERRRRLAHVRDRGEAEVVETLAVRIAAPARRDVARTHREREAVVGLLPRGRHQRERTPRDRPRERRGRGRRLVVRRVVVERHRGHVVARVHRLVPGEARRHARRHARQRHAVRPPVVHPRRRAGSDAPRDPRAAWLLPGVRRLRHGQRTVFGRNLIVFKSRACARRDREGRFRLARRRPLGEVPVGERLARRQDGQPLPAVRQGHVNVVRCQPQRRAVVGLHPIARPHRDRTRRDRDGRPVRIGVIAGRIDRIPDRRCVAGVRQQEAFDIRAVLCECIRNLRVRDARHLNRNSMSLSVIHTRITEAAVLAARSARAVVDVDFMRRHDKCRRQRRSDLRAVLCRCMRQDVVPAFAWQRPMVDALARRRFHDFAVDGDRRRHVCITRPQVAVRDVFRMAGLDRPLPRARIDHHLAARRGRRDRDILDDRNDRIGGLAHRIAVHDGNRRKPFYIRKRRLKRFRVD